MRTIPALLLSLSLSACGAVYSSPHVQPGTAEVGDVFVVQLTAETIIDANKSPYRPRALPASLSQTPDALTPANRVIHLPPSYQSGSYKIGVGDVVAYISTSNDNITINPVTGLPVDTGAGVQHYMVQDDGAISLPEIGRVHIAGLSLEEAEAELFQTLSRSQADPAFSIEIEAFNSQKVQVDGAVRRPTAVPITIKPLTLADALTAAGGIATANRDFATIRLNRDGVLYQFPVQAYFDNAAIQAMPLKNGDSIFADYTLDLQNAELNARRSNFLTKVSLDAVQRDYVYIAGEVGVQNRFPLPFERKATLADALYAQTRGIPSTTGSIAELYVLRTRRDGKGITAWKLNAVNAANLVLATRFELRPNDIIFVAEQPVTALNRMLGQALPAIAFARSL